MQGLHIAIDSRDKLPMPRFVGGDSTQPRVPLAQFLTGHSRVGHTDLLLSLDRYDEFVRGVLIVPGGRSINR